MRNNNLEIRTISCQRPHLREATAEGEESRIIEGYACVFNQPSEVLVDYNEDNYIFREIIAPNAISQDSLKGYDVKMTMFHNREKLLARARFGEGTLMLSVDNVGLRFSAEMPKTMLGDEAIEMVRRGDIVGCSFAYINSADGVEWQYNEDVPTRIVNNIIDIRDVTLAIDPAYNQTSVSLRECNVGAHGRDSWRVEAQKRERKVKLINLYTHD